MLAVLSQNGFYNSFFIAKITLQPKDFDGQQAKLLSPTTRRKAQFLDPQYRHLKEALFPINVNNQHWIFVAVFGRKIVWALDSLFSRNIKYCNHVFNFILKMYRQYHKTSMPEAERNSWSLVNKKPSFYPQQPDGNSCGAFICLCMLRIAHNRDINIDKKEYKTYNAAACKCGRAMIGRVILEHQPWVNMYYAGTIDEDPERKKYGRLNKDRTNYTYMKNLRPTDRKRYTFTTGEDEIPEKAR